MSFVAATKGPLHVWDSPGVTDISLSHIIGQQGSTRFSQHPQDVEAPRCGCLTNTHPTHLYPPLNIRQHSNYKLPILPIDLFIRKCINVTKLACICRYIFYNEYFCLTSYTFYISRHLHAIYKIHDWPVIILCKKIHTRLNNY